MARQRDYNQQIVMRDLSQFSKVYLVPLADFHIGTDSAIDVIQGYINWIKERDNAFTFLNGDLMNCAIKTSTSELFVFTYTVLHHSFFQRIGNIERSSKLTSHRIFSFSRVSNIPLTTLRC